jgi:hypothetical protein
VRFTIISQLVFLICVGCSTSQITHSWKNERIKNGEYKKILVLGIFNETYNSVRQKMELHMVGDLESRGYHAVSAYEEYGPNGLKTMNEKSAVDQLNTGEYVAVLTIVLLSKSRKRQYAPVKVSTPSMIDQPGLWGYYRSTYDKIGANGYYSVETRYFWESNFYDMRSGELIYAVQTQTFNPESAENMAHEYGKLIVRDIVKRNVFTKQKS